MKWWLCAVALLITTDLIGNSVLMTLRVKTKMVAAGPTAADPLATRD